MIPLRDSDLVGCISRSLYENILTYYYYIIQTTNRANLNGGEQKICFNKLKQILCK